MTNVLFSAASLIILALAGYAGYLLTLLYKQGQRQKAARAARIEKITESIQTIALATVQQQCDLSEASIRLCVLLDAIPVLPQPDYRGRFPALHALYDRVKNLPTHEARAQQNKLERRKMDLSRSEWEAELESQILLEAETLAKFSV